MNKKHNFLLLILVVAIFILLGFYPQHNNDGTISGKLKVVLRQVGNELLLSNKDSTSLILPVKEISRNTYQISFNNYLSFEPNKLVDIIKLNLDKTTINKNYRVEVLQCLDKEVAYSYEINIDKEKTIVPCSGRILPTNCYLIQIQFLENSKSNNSILYYIFIPLILGFLYVQLALAKKKKFLTKQNAKKQKILGSFIFYPEQNKLVKQAKEIALSKKECELLEIFIANANQVVKREELTKRVWEDNGVIVGRSLDTYVSKLRKKLQEDQNIKLINVHGIGYKLEVK